MHMEFLYFPEDKSEYISSLLTLAVFIVAAMVAVYIFYRKSKKEDIDPPKEYPKHIDPESDDDEK